MFSFFLNIVIKCISSISDTGDSEEKNPSSPNRSRTYMDDLLVTSPDATGNSWELRLFN